VIVADDYARFASVEARGQSSVYEALAASISKDPGVLGLIGSLPETKRQPNLLFASVRFLGGPVEDYTEFGAWLREHWGSVRATIQSRRTQTNEPGRCAVLAPVLSLLPGPLALLEVGASAGLCLYPDRYRYTYGSHEIGDPASPVHLRCEVIGSAPVPTRLPNVVWRGGIDLNPLDPGDPEDLRWLESLVWPGQTDRLARLRAAAAIAASHPPNLVAGHLNTELPGLVARVPPEATLVVFHSAVLTYLSMTDRSRFVHQVRALPARWLSNEGPAVLANDGITPPSSPAPEGSHFLLALDGVPMAWAGAHGQTLQWLSDR
jgi:hypothetical protein